MEQVKLFKGKNTPQKVYTGAQTSELSFSSPEKMDEKGVHSAMNPVQTVAGNDISNPFRAVTLPKSEDESSPSRQR